MEEFTGYEEYDIIETIRTEGFDYMKDITGYILVTDKQYRIFKQYIEEDKNCTDLLYKLTKDGVAGDGLYVYSKANVDYLKEKVNQDTKFLIQLNMRSRRQLSLSNVYKKEDMDIINKLSNAIEEKGLKQESLKDFIESVINTVNIKPDIFAIPSYKSLNNKCKSIYEFIGTKLFIRKADIGNVVNSCSVVELN